MTVEQRAARRTGASGENEGEQGFGIGIEHVHADMLGRKRRRRRQAPSLIRVGKFLLGAAYFASGCFRR